MKLALLRIKEFLPEINERVITPARIFEIFAERNITYCEADLQDSNGCYASAKGRDYVVLKRSLSYLLYYETLALETVHAILHDASAAFLLQKHKKEAETLSLVAMMPEPDLPRLCREAGSLDAETYYLLKKRLRVLERWQI